MNSIEEPIDLSAFINRDDVPRDVLDFVCDLLETGGETAFNLAQAEARAWLEVLRLMKI